MRLLPAMLGLLRDPMARGLDLDGAEAAAVHGTLIRRKAFLAKLYRRYYEDLAGEARAAPGGPIVEVGSGAGFLEEVLPAVIRTDLRPGARVDLRASATALPFEEGRVAALLGLDVLHHVDRPVELLREAARVLAPGGRLALVEPFASPLSRQIFRRFHHEAFDPDRPGWEQHPEGPMTGVDSALSWVVLVRDGAELATVVPELEVVRVTPHTVLLYLLSGGLSYRSLAPGVLFGPIAACEELLPPSTRALVASMMTVVLRRRGGAQGARGATRR